MSLNAAEAEAPRWIQQYATQVYQWRQMVNTEEIIKKQLLDSLDEKYFKVQRQTYINCTNLILAVYNEWIMALSTQ